MANSAVAVLSHDPFSRTSVVRRKVDTKYGCDECGWTATHDSPGLLQYGTRADDSLSGSISWHRGLFCSKTCHDAYHQS